MAISVVQMSLIIPFSVYFIVSDGQDMVPWPGWAEAHARYTDTPIIPAVIWRSGPHAPVIEMSRWAQVLTAIIYFIFFGFAREARMKYRHVLDLLTGRHTKGAARGAARASLLPDFFTIGSQRSRPDPSQSVAQTLTVDDFRRACFSPPAALADNNPKHSPAFSDSTQLLQLPKFTHSVADNTDWFSGAEREGNLP